MGESSGVHVIVDPYIFQMPSYLDESEGVAYVQSLVKWCKFFKKLRGYCSTSSKGVAALWEGKHFPTLNTLSRLLGGLEEYSANDLRNALRVISDLQPYFEDVVGITDIIVGSTLESPGEIFQRLTASTAIGLRSTLFTAAVARSVSGRFGQLLFGTRLATLSASQVTIAGMVEMYSTASGDVVELRKSVEDAFEVTEDCHSVCKHLEVHSIYKEPHLAATAAAWQADPNMVQTVLSAAIVAGPDFVGSLEAKAVHRQHAVLSRLFYLVAMAACDRIDDVEGAHVHPVRISRSANSDQVSRADGSKLWRCMLTKEGAGLRLQYWKMSGVGIELQKVVAESEV